MSDVDLEAASGQLAAAWKCARQAAQRYLGPWSGEAEDVASAVVVMLIERYLMTGRFDSQRGRLTTLAHRAAWFIAQAAARAARRRPVCADLGELPETEPTATREVCELVTRRLRELPPHLARAIELRYFEGIANSAAAAELGATYETYARWLFLARERLSEDRELREYCGRYAS